MANRQDRAAEAARYERLSKEVDDRELSRYYAGRAAELRNDPGPDEVKQELELIKSRVTAQVKGDLLAQKIRKAAGNPIVRTDNAMANQTARQGLLAQAGAADNEALQLERLAQEKMDAVRNVSDRTLINHYSEQARELRTKAELARSRAKAHRAAAAGL